MRDFVDGEEGFFGSGNGESARVCSKGVPESRGSGESVKDGEMRTTVKVEVVVPGEEVKRF